MSEYRGRHRAKTVNAAIGAHIDGQFRDAFAIAYGQERYDEVFGLPRHSADFVKVAS